MKRLSKPLTITGLFSGGVEKFTLKAPIVILDKDLLSRDGAWKVKVKLSYTYTIAEGIRDETRNRSNHSRSPN